MTMLIGWFSFFVFVYAVYQYDKAERFKEALERVHDYGVRHRDAGYTCAVIARRALDGKTK